jgi:hypothetical protein
VAKNRISIVPVDDNDMMRGMLRGEEYDWLKSYFASREWRQK